MERPTAAFCNEKYSVLNNFCYVETSKTCTIPKFRPKILPDNEIAEGINSLNSSQ